jgi:hypothetical protein
MSNTKNYSRRTFLRNTVQAGGILLLSQYVPIVGESKSLSYEDTLIVKTQTVEETITQYIQAWNEKGVEKIKAALGKCWVDDGTYTDPNNPPTKGFNGLAAVIQSSWDKMPERKFSQISKADFHHNSGRFKWLVTRKDGSKTEGLDYFEYDSENRITRIVGFSGVLS